MFQSSYTKNINLVLLYFNITLEGKLPKQNQIENATETLEKLQEPIRYKVILLNDDYTTQDFVIEILQKISKKN